MPEGGIDCERCKPEKGLSGTVVKRADGKYECLVCRRTYSV